MQKYKNISNDNSTRKPLVNQRVSSSWFFKRPAVFFIVKSSKSHVCGRVNKSMKCKKIFHNSQPVPDDDRFLAILLMQILAILLMQILAILLMPFDFI
jgi:hypothetical protein